MKAGPKKFIRCVALDWILLGRAKEDCFHFLNVGTAFQDRTNMDSVMKSTRRDVSDRKTQNREQSFLEALLASSQRF